MLFEHKKSSNMNIFPYLLSISFLAADPGDKVGITTVISNDQARNFGMGHAGANANFIQQLRNTTTLPVTLVSFDAKTTNRFVKIDWKTATESNSSHFILKRSGDGTNFQELVKIQAAKESLAILQYQYIDRSPLKGNNYYQLDQFDADGTKSLSKIIVVNYDLKEQQVYAYFSKEGILNTVVNAPSQQELVSVNIYDTNGRKIASERLNINQTTHHSFDNIFFKKGVYVISISLKDQVINQKLIK